MSLLVIPHVSNFCKAYVNSKLNKMYVQHFIVLTHTAHSILIRERHK